MKILSCLSLVACLATVSGFTYAGRTTGPYYDEDALRPGQTVTYNLEFRGGDPALVRVIGDGDGDIDCNVMRRGTGMVLDSDTDGEDGCLLRWYPSYPGVFTIRLVNNGSISSAYVIRTN